jgi:hypothetical protein
VVALLGSLVRRFVWECREHRDDPRFGQEPPDDTEDIQGVSQADTSKTHKDVMTQAWGWDVYTTFTKCLHSSEPLAPEEVALLDDMYPTLVGVPTVEAPVGLEGSALSSDPHAGRRFGRELVANSELEETRFLDSPKWVVGSACRLEMVNERSDGGLADGRAHFPLPLCTLHPVLARRHPKERGALWGVGGLHRLSPGFLTCLRGGGAIG